MTESLDIAENTPATMPCDIDEIETTPNHPKALPKATGDDLSEGIIQAALATRYVVKRQSVGNAIKRGSITQWLEKQGADFDGICWRYDSEKKLFFPLN